MVEEQQFVVEAPPAPVSDREAWAYRQLLQVQQQLQRLQERVAELEGAP